MNLDGKVTIVTGAASGIGEAIVRRFLEASARVVAVDEDVRLPSHLAGAAAAHEGCLRCVVGDVAEGITAESSGKTTPLPARPCLTEFLRDRILPPSVVGPVDFRAFSRLASICRCVVMAG